MHQFCLFLKMWGRKYSFDTVNHQSSCPIWSKMCSLMTKVATCHQTDLVGCWITRLSMGFMSYHHTYFVVVAPKLQFLIGWLLINTIIDWTFGVQDSWVALVRSQFRAIVVRCLVLFPDIIFSPNSKMIFLECFYVKIRYDGLEASLIVLFERL